LRKSNKKPINLHKRHKRKITRVSIDFPEEEHRKIKAKAALDGVSIQQWIRNRIDLADNTIPDEEFDKLANKIIDEKIEMLKRLADK